ncbi:MAG: hypothetical protein K0S98_1129, partial [Propionibacteriaceae bacterium]|nr:hypothetical protein [Propionibacteriaceae bacterium]
CGDVSSNRSRLRSRPSQCRSPEDRGRAEDPRFSGYLHPIGDSLLLGVGQSGDGETTDICPSPQVRGGPGVQFSFVRHQRPRVARRIDMQTYGGGLAAAEFDPKAFLH